MQALMQQLLAILAPPLSEGLQESCVAGCPGTALLSSDRKLLQLQPLRPYAAGDFSSAVLGKGAMNGWMCTINDCPCACSQALRPGCCSFNIYLM